MMEIHDLTQAQLASYFDHTLLKPYATDDDFRKLCKEAKEAGAAMVAINSADVSLCKALLKDSNVHVGAAISFPLGQTTLEIKLAETAKAIADGADEIDYVINIAKAKMHDWSYIETEMKEITKLCHDHKVICKVIFENCYLTSDEIKKLAEIAKKIKPDFIKTSTGFGTSGAKVEDVKLMKAVVQDEVKVKAAGGIRDWKTCKQMMEAGATRIGTSSTLKILEDFNKATMGRCHEEDNI